MLLQLAWKNIWRNKIRSGIVLGSVALGLWVGAFMMSYSFGMMNQRLKDAVENEVCSVLYATKHAFGKSTRIWLFRSLHDLVVAAIEIVSGLSSTLK